MTPLRGCPILNHHRYKMRKGVYRYSSHGLVVVFRRIPFFGGFRRHHLYSNQVSILVFYERQSQLRLVFTAAKQTIFYQAM